MNRILPDTYTVVVSAEDANARIDQLLPRHVPKLTRSQAKRIIDRGFVSANGRTLKASDVAALGTRVEVRLPEAESTVLIPEEIPLSILFEDEHLIVIDKPAGLVVHPGAGNPRGTLVHALLAHCGSISGGDASRPGIVHRLDRGTSGVMVAAKNEAVHAQLSRQFSSRQVEKRYLALVIGRPRADSGRFDAPIGRHRRQRQKMSSHTAKGREALTEWRVQERVGAALTLLELRLHTGRTHQIRVHCSEAGFPLVGDETYGATSRARSLRPKELQQLVLEFPRPALHACLLAFDHPESGERMRFEAPVPQDLLMLLSSCRNMESTEKKK